MLLISGAKSLPTISGPFDARAAEF